MKPFKLKYKNSSFPFKSPLRLDGSDPDTVKANIAESDTLNTTLADQVYRKSKVDTSLINRGYDINTRTVNERGQTKVSKLDKRITNKKDNKFKQTMLPPEDYNQAQG